RIVFMGSPEFAVPSLEALLKCHEVLAVYTRADSVRGRGRTVIPTPVKSAAIEAGLTVEQPTTLRDPDTVRRLAAYRPDVICVAAYGMILPPEVLAIPPLGCLNVHASMLPRHRGAAPIHRAILDADEHTGVVIMRMEEGLDTGPFTALRTTKVGDKTVESLSSELAVLGADALIEALDALAAGSVEWTAQDEASATYAAKMTDADVSLTPDLDVKSALRRVRASTSSARSKIVACGRRVDVLVASPSNIMIAPGRVLHAGDDLVVGFADGSLRLDVVRAEGRGAIEGHAFACGARIDADEHWSSAE
ncbi:MAG: methionyl-tRNA formyltransferase, partial [Actinomycetota bacterium]|nr:methionyl-tRNA formyltransferase [Actinomycetota bacterium]